MSSNLFWVTGRANQLMAKQRMAKQRMTCKRTACLLLAGVLAGVLTAGGCAQLATTMLVNVAPELLAVTLGQYKVRKEFEEAARLITARDWLGLSTLARQKLVAQPNCGRRREYAYILPT